MNNLTKESKKLEKAGFSGRTLEKALELMERTRLPVYRSENADCLCG